MMKKAFFSDALIYLLCIVAGLLGNLAVEWLIYKMVGKFIRISFLAGAFLSLFVAIVVVGGVMCAMVVFDSYRTASFSPRNTLLPMLGAFVVQLAFSFLLGFHPAVAGGTRHLAGLMAFGGGYNTRGMVGQIPIWAHLISFVLLCALTILVCAIGGKVAAMRRLRFREELTGSEHAEE